METIWFRVREYKGKPRADARVYYRDDTGELKPTKKGVCIAPDIWPQFAQRIESVLAKSWKLRGCLRRSRRHEHQSHFQKIPIQNNLADRLENGEIIVEDKFGRKAKKRIPDH